ncbi:MAG: FtsX-like permease family protein [Candidatus Nomurabacteria bacterium]|nr:FtsX-like permease family protein [Candidatus Nomurabacteria bacterium]
MRKVYILTRAIKSLKQSKARTVLTALAIAVGATTICLALAAGNGGRDYIDKTLLSSEDAQKVFAMGKYDSEKQEYLYLSPEVIEQIRNMNEIETAEVNCDDEETLSDCSSVSIVVRDGYDTQKVAEKIRGMSPNIATNTDADNRKEMYDAINVAQWGLIGFGALAVIASIFGIINTQYISVLERTRQIGLMKALGMKRGDVSRLFRYEAAWIGFLGGAIGVAVAWLITLANPLISKLLNLADDMALLRIDWLQAAILIVALMAVAVLSGWFPARKAAKLDPIEALRTE